MIDESVNCVYGFRRDGTVITIGMDGLQCVIEGYVVQNVLRLSGEDNCVREGRWIDMCVLNAEYRVTI